MFTCACREQGQSGESEIKRAMSLCELPLGLLLGLGVGERGCLRGGTVGQAWELAVESRSLGFNDQQAHQRKPGL